MSKKIKNRQNNCGFISSVHFPLSMNVIYDLNEEEREMEDEKQSVTVTFCRLSLVVQWQ